MKAILFDLDGTLLLIKKGVLSKEYLKRLVDKLCTLGFSGDESMNALLKSLDAMHNNNGKENNEMVFWNELTTNLGKDALKVKSIFDDFYNKEFNEIKSFCSFTDKANEIIKELKNLGYKLVLASNPVFPKVAQEGRMKWAGVNPTDFDLITSYEDFHFTKPNIKYYEEILNKIDCRPEDCIMVGNDVTEDMVASDLGLQTFLLTEYLVNKHDKDISIYNKGTFDDLKNFIKGFEL